jgi:hypothetical protein
MSLESKGFSDSRLMTPRLMALNNGELPLTGWLKIPDGYVLSHPQKQKA